MQGPVAAVSSMNDGGMTVVFTAEGRQQHRLQEGESHFLVGYAESRHGRSATYDFHEEGAAR